MPTVPQRAIFHKAWSDPLAPAENPRSFPIGSNVRITDQALLDRVDSADVAHISANFDLTAPGDIGSGTAGNGWFNNLVVGAAALLAAGSVAAPALAASGDTNTGIYFPAADQVGIAVGGSSGLVVTSTGIGRGTTNPQRPLHIEHTGSIVAEFARSDNGQILELDGAGYSAHHTLDGTAYFIGHGSASRGLGLQINNSTALYIATSSQVGIGTTSPGQTLDVVGIAQATRFYVTDGNAVIERSSGALSLQTYAGNHILLQPGGSVGIGTTSPTRPLHVNGTTRTGNADAASALEIWGTGAARGVIWASTLGVGLYHADFTGRVDVGSGYVALSATGSEGARLASTGFGIGTTNPQEKLHLNGNLRIDNGSMLYNGFREIRQVSVTNQGIGIQGGTSNVTGASISLYGSTNTGQAGKMFLSYGGAASTGALVIRHYNGTAFVTRAYLDDVGNLGLGTTDPQRTLHVDGTVRLQNLPTSSGGLSAGDLWNDGGTVKIV